MRRSPEGSNASAVTGDSGPAGSEVFGDLGVDLLEPIVRRDDLYGQVGGNEDVPGRDTIAGETAASDEGNIRLPDPLSVRAEALVAGRPAEDESQAPVMDEA